MAQRIFLAFFALALTQACEPASPLVDTSGVQVAAKADVAACKPVSILTTTTGVTGTIAQDKAMELARNETKSMAREAGANTIVFQNGGPGSEDLFVRAEAYVC